MSFARPVAGGLSMATQSGNMGATLMHLGEHTGIGFARLVSVGNSARLGVEEFLHWFARDDATRAVALYVEGVRDGARFLRVLRDAAARKPVVVLKGGRTAGGADAARSHTGALAGRADLFGRLCEQAGAVTVRTIEELFDVAAASSALRVPRGPRTGIVTVGGGWGVVAADAVEEHGLELAPLTPELRAELDTVLPDRWSRRNPVDMVGDIGPRAMSRCIDIVVRSGAYDAVLHLGGGLAGYAGRHVRSSPFFPDHLLGLFSEEGAKRDDRLGHALAELAEIPDCTLVFGADAAASPDAAENPGLRPIRDLGHPIYPSPERAVRALAALVRRGRIAGRLAAPPEDAEPVPADRIAEAARGIRNAADAGLAVLAEEAAATILERAGVPFAPFRTAADPDAAADAASRLGFPVVLKGAGPTLAHKSEDGLVRLDLASPRAVHDAAAELLERPGVERLLVARRIAARREFLAGVVRDPSFGPVAVVGLGGVLTEAIADVAYVRFPAPVGDLRDAIDGLRGRALFGPFRGEAPIDPAGLAAILRTLTALADAEPAVEAIDLNPLLADAAGRLTAVDALVTLRTPGS
jgi:acetyltransferase